MPFLVFNNHKVNSAIIQPFLKQALDPNVYPGSVVLIPDLCVSVILLAVKANNDLPFSR